MDRQKLIKSLYEYINKPDAKNNKKLLFEDMNRGYVDELWQMNAEEIYHMITYFHEREPLEQECYINAADEILKMNTIAEYKDEGYYEAIEQLSLQRNPSDDGDSIEDIVGRRHTDEIDSHAQYYSDDRYSKYKKFKESQENNIISESRLRKLSGLDNE